MRSDFSSNAKSMKEYIARAKCLAINVQYYGIEVSDQEISRRLLNGLPSTYAREKRSFALRTDYGLGDLAGGLVRVKELNRSLVGTDGSYALAAGFKPRSGGQGGQGGGCNGDGDRSGRGKRDGKGRLPKYQQYQPEPQQQQQQQ